MAVKNASLLIQCYFPISLDWSLSHNAYFIEPSVILTGFYSDGRASLYSSTWIVDCSHAGKMSLCSLTSSYSGILTNGKTKLPLKERFIERLNQIKQCMFLTCATDRVCLRHYRFISSKMLGRIKLRPVSCRMSN